MKKSNGERIEDYLRRFRQQSNLGAPGALEQFRLLREVKRNLPSQYEHFCTELRITPRQAEQSYEVAYNLSILARYEKFERQATLSIAGCSNDEEFDDVWFRLQAWEKLTADQIRNEIVAKRLEDQAAELMPSTDRMQ
jgi:hypothetical protein